MALEYGGPEGGQAIPPGLCWPLIASSWSLLLMSIIDVRLEVRRALEGGRASANNNRKRSLRTAGTWWPTLYPIMSNLPQNLSIFILKNSACTVVLHSQLPFTIKSSAEASAYSLFNAIDHCDWALIKWSNGVIWQLLKNAIQFEYPACVLLQNHVHLNARSKLYGIITL